MALLEETVEQMVEDRKSSQRWRHGIAAGITVSVVVALLLQLASFFKAAAMENMMEKAMKQMQTIQAPASTLPNP